MKTQLLSRIAMLFIALFFIAGCTAEKPKPQYPSDVTFEFDITELTPSTMVAMMTPSDMDCKYIGGYWEEIMSDEQAQEWLQQSIAQWMESDPEVTKEYIIKQMSMTGEQRFSQSYAEPGGEYYLVVFGIDDQGVMTTSAYTAKVVHPEGSGSVPTIEPLTLTPGDQDGAHPTTTITANVTVKGAKVQYGRCVFISEVVASYYLSQGMSYLELVGQGQALTAEQIKALNSGSCKISATQSALSYDDSFYSGEKVLFIVQVVSEGGFNALAYVKGATSMN